MQELHRSAIKSVFMSPQWACNVENSAKGVVFRPFNAKRGACEPEKSKRSEFLGVESAAW